MKRLAPIFDVAICVALFWVVRKFLSVPDTPFIEWQAQNFGRSIVTSSIVFFVVPSLWLILRRVPADEARLSAYGAAHDLKVAGRMVSIMILATLLFPIIEVLGTSQVDWLGAGILTIGFGTAGLFAFRLAARIKPARDVSKTIRPFSSTSLALLIGMGAIFLLHDFSAIASRVLVMVLFVGFLEEYFFRGILQSRLNACFGRPWSVWGVQFGAGLVITAVLFGLFHPLSSSAPFPWPWAVWTGATGIVFGLVREKTGSVLASALVHGGILIPAALFVPA